MLRIVAVFLLLAPAGVFAQNGQGGNNNNQGNNNNNQGNNNRGGNVVRTPEPSTALLVLGGAAGMAAFAQFRKRRR
jgi:hypothetical protein